MRRNALAILPFVLAVAIAAAAMGQPGTAADFARFVGHYVGQTVFASDQGLTMRDLDVVISHEGKGFAVGWTTITQKPSGEVTRKRHLVAFRPTERPGIYLPAERVRGVRLDPLKGDPRVWARVKGDTLSVYAVIITEDGGYEMQTYDRRLIPGGMALNFSRVRDGLKLKEIRARLSVQSETKGGRR